MWASIYEKDRKNKTVPKIYCSAGYAKGCESRLPRIDLWCPWCRGNYEAKREEREEKAMRNRALGTEGTEGQANEI